ncbi:MAG: hypothetical protein ACREMZ_14545 [Gemmatimonadales bacterium]
MRNLFILAVAASFAVACAGRTEDDMGAAPERDTTAVIDDTTAIIADTAQAYPTDTTYGQVETDTSFVEQDTSFVEQDTTPYDPGMEADTVGAQGEVPADDTTGEWTDTTETEPADTAAQY